MSKEEVRAYERIIEHIENLLVETGEEPIRKRILEKDRALLKGLLEVIDEKTLAEAVRRAKKHLKPV